MRALLAAATVLLLAGCASSGFVAVDGGDTSPRQILVTVRQPATAAAGLTGAPNQLHLQRRYGPSPSVDRILTQLAREHGLQRVDGWAIQSLDVYCEVYTVPEGQDVAELIEALRADPRVDLAQRMNTFSTQAGKYDDPYIDLQSAATLLEVEEAHTLATGRGVSIAIIDSAIDAGHPDLRGRVRVTRNLVPGRPVGSGELHGTAIAGIIASVANNNEGIVGVAPDVDIAALRACWAVAAERLAARCSSFSLAQALEVAIALDPQVINLSVAGPQDPLLARLLDRVLDRGIVVVAAYPAEARQEHAFPSSHPRVIAAHSSATQVDSPSPFVLAAPADEVLTTTPGARYSFLTGNSLAAAHATGVVALLKERQPDLDVERIAAILSSTTSYSPGRASINACRAVSELTGTARCAPQAARADAF